MDSNIQIIIGKPGTNDYLNLRKEVGWHLFDKGRADIALDNSVFMVYAKMQNNVVGFGRIVGDGQTYFYIQDILVSPRFQNMGIGTEIMKILMNFLDEKAPEKSGAFIGMMIAPGLFSFYSKFGFEKFPSETPALRIWRNGH